MKAGWFRLILCVLGGGIWLGCASVLAWGVDSVDVCAICGRPFVEVYYSIQDEVTLEKKHICKICEQSFPDCFVCGLPADTNVLGFISLPDHRALCARDSKTAVLREEEGIRICREVRDTLDRLFSRFTSFPDANTTLKMVDRVHLQELFKLAGHDYQCPNVWGITDTRTNKNRVCYEISLMSALPLRWFQATCAHEYGHTWVGEHLTQARKDSLGRDAEEGFCELLAYLYMDAQNDESQKGFILRNAYTRGQIDLFVAAQRGYGFNEILDWMQFGIDDELSESDPGRIRKLSQTPTRPPPAASYNIAQVPGYTLQKTPSTLILKAIFWDQKHPLAMINDHTFGVNEEGRVHIGDTNLTLRCLAIQPDAVRFRVAGSAADQTLMLKPAGGTGR